MKKKKEINQPDLGIFFLELFNVSVSPEKFRKKYFINESKLAVYEIMEYIHEIVDDDNICFNYITDLKKIHFTLEVDGQLINKTGIFFKTDSNDWEKKIQKKVISLFKILKTSSNDFFLINIETASLLREKSLRITQKLASYDHSNVLNEFFYGKYSIENDKSKLKRDLEKYLKSVYIEKVPADVKKSKRVYFVSLPFTYTPSLPLDNLLDFNFTKTNIFRVIDRLFDLEADNLIYYSIFEIEILLITTVEEVSFPAKVIRNNLL
ncbi:MAG: hypothetical protein PHV06_02815 [bacterium]|nr:hypothetical protein [bacterium]